MDTIKQVADLEQYRLQYGLSKMQMAEIVGICLRTYLYWIKGEKKPNESNWYKLQIAHEALAKQAKKHKKNGASIEAIITKRAQAATSNTRKA